MSFEKQHPSSLGCLGLFRVTCLFDNVNRVVFHKKNYDQILSLQSQEGETVPLSEPIVAQVKDRLLILKAVK